MARLRISLGLVLGAAVALSGCPSSTTPSSVPIEMLGATYGSVSCQIIRDCYGDTLVRLLSGASDQAACEARAEAAYTNGALPRYQAAIAMGTLTYDGSQATACVNALTAEGCAAISARTPSACDGLFVGHVAPGGACALDEECMGDAYCSATTACPGTCQAYGASGSACTRDQACQTGLRCGNGTCMAPGGAGAACQGTTGVECSGGLICAGGSPTRTGACTAITDVFVGADGAACNAQMGQLCVEGLSCIVASVTSQTCGAGGLAVGAACHLSVPDQCAPGSYCNGPNLAATPPVFDGTCAPLPTAGMPCATVVTGQNCADGFACTPGPGPGVTTCHEVQDNGGACTGAEGCHSGLCSAGGSGTSPSCLVPTYCPPTP